MYFTGAGGVPTPAMLVPAVPTSGPMTVPAGTSGMEKHRSFIYAFNVCRASIHVHHKRVGIHRFVAKSLLPVEEDLSKHCSLLCTFLSLHKRWLHHPSLSSVSLFG